MATVGAAPCGRPSVAFTPIQEGRESHGQARGPVPTETADRLHHEAVIPAINADRGGRDCPESILIFHRTGGHAFFVARPPDTESREFAFRFCVRFRSSPPGRKAVRTRKRKGKRRKMDFVEPSFINRVRSPALVGSDTGMTVSTPDCGKDQQPRGGQPEKRGFGAHFPAFAHLGQHRIQSKVAD